MSVNLLLRINIGLFLAITQINGTVYYMEWSDRPVGSSLISATTLGRRAVQLSLEIATNFHNSPGVKMENLIRFVCAVLMAVVFNSTVLAETIVLTNSNLALAGSPEQIIRNNCAGCHLPGDDGKLSRISYQRRTPEGWEMSITRMRLVHRVHLSDQETPVTADIIRKLVKYFSDRQGLAPTETADYRYILERRPNVIEQHQDEEFAISCARCHSGARSALQRRPEKEWAALMHFHLGQFPSIEYSLGGRDRNWLDVVLNNIVPYLAEKYPLDSQAWSDWQKAKKPELGGRWRLVGNQPGKGDFEGVMNVTETVKDSFSVTFSGSYQDGGSVDGKGTAQVYTGYEWRATLDIGGQTFNQVMAANRRGDSMSGRMFEREHDETGVQLTAIKMDGRSHVLAVIPNYIKAGAKSTISLMGTALKGDVDFGDGIIITDILSRDNEKIRLNVTANQDTPIGKRDVTVGQSRLANGFVIYDQVARLEIQPSYAVARVGDNGGKISKARVAFQAVAYSDGRDGKSRTEDDLRIGFMPAEWSVKPFDAVAEENRDVEFAGVMDKNTGVFTPGSAGPNPKRKNGTSNVGNLTVVVSIQEGENLITAAGHLIIAPQRWINPPIH